MARNSARYSSADSTAGLGLLGALAGTWKGHGFNLIARPDFEDKTDLYLQLNHTRETLSFTPIGSPVPNRGFRQDDITLYGLTYLQKINDAGHDGALHIEPGIWATQPNTTFPTDSVAPPAQIVFRLGTIPHGNALLAQGIAESFTGTPVLEAPGALYNFSKFPSFNSTPFPAPPTVPKPLINAAGTSEKLLAAALGVPAFPAYDLSIAPAPTPLPPALQAIFNVNARTPFDTAPPEAPIANTPDNQALIDDPIVFLQNDVQKLVDEGYTFKGTVLNIATFADLSFVNVPNAVPAGTTPPASTTVSLPQAGGGAENIQFLNGQNVSVQNVEQPVANAQTALVYATFWIETVTHEATGHTFEQLQYVQSVMLDFPIFHLLNPTAPTLPTYTNLAWPHISVATLRKTWG